MVKQGWRFALLGCLFALILGMAGAQDSTDARVTLRLEAGYEGYYRENHWLPIRIHADNRGDAILGTLVVRPQTSGRVVANTYSTPIDLPAGAERSLTLYIQARTFPPRVIVEMLTPTGERIAQAEAGIFPVNPDDQLHLTISGAISDAPNLQGVHSGGQSAQQARFRATELPDMPEALAPLDIIMLTNITGDALTVAQHEALRQYVIRGGHLIITGGTTWQGALTDLMPVTPLQVTTTEDVQAIADIIGDRQADLRQTTSITQGELKQGAYALAEDGAGVPLIARHRLGEGVVDFIAADPTLEPLRSWDNLPRLWSHLLITRPVTVGWVRGIVDYDESATAISILPNIDLLPDVETMLAYIAVYILLIGPVNYIILSRIERRGWAWVTIPALIIGFSLLSWTVGFNLRGDDIIISRLSVVQSWHDNDDAHLTQLVGVLSPRRTTHTLLDNGEGVRPMRVLPPVSRTGILAQNISQSSADIAQNGDFSARNVTVDGGIFANFSVQGRVDAPAIGGRLTLTYHEEGTQALRGSIRNDSDITLEDAVLLYRGGVYRLDAPFAPDDLLTFGGDDLLIVYDEAFPTAAPFEYVYGLPTQSLISAREFFRAQANLQTTFDILGTTPSVRLRQSLDANDPQAQTLARREALLKAILRDQFSSPARANQAYLVGWADTWARDVDLVNSQWRDVVTTLYIIALDVTVDTDTAPERVHIYPDQFAWGSLHRENIEGRGIDDMILLQGAVGEFRFVPQQGNVLDDVQALIVTLDRTSSYGRDVELSLWDWQAGEWRNFGAGVTQIYEIDEPANFIGHDNAVDVRLTFDGILGTVRVRGLTVEQIGGF